MTISPAGWMPTCTRCKVQRHDRCIGPMECSCQAPEHHHPAGDEWVPPDADEGEPEGTVHHMDPDDETVIVEMQTRLYAQLLQAAQAQERDPGVVLKRALEHYLSGCEAGCRHSHDERPGGTEGALAGNEEAGVPGSALGPPEAAPLLTCDDRQVGH